MTLKERFLAAVRQGELGRQTECGTVVSVAEFKAYFADINEGYAETFLPAAVIEPGQFSMTQTRFVFRVKNGVYRVHPQAVRHVDQGSTVPDARQHALQWCHARKN